MDRLAGRISEETAQGGAPIIDPRTQLGRGEDRVGLPIEQAEAGTISAATARGAERSISLPPLKDPFEQYRDRTGGHA